ncbi:hypothetical protein BP312_01351 [Bordetella pertussis]|nr:hypothetical protein BP312_01351 [Bordetella pertussis]
MGVGQGVDVDGTAGRRVFGGIFQQVAQHPFDQDAIAFHQRQGRKRRDRDGAILQRGVHGRQGRAHQFLDRLPLAPQRRIVALQPRHVQQVDDQRVHAPRLVLHGGHGFERGRRHGGGRALQGLGHAEQAGQRRAQIVRDRRQQGVAQAFGFDTEQRLLGDFHIVQPFDGDGDQGGVGVELAARRRRAVERRAGVVQGQHAAHPHGRAQGQVQHGAVRQGVGAGAAGLAVVEGPLRQRGFECRVASAGRQPQPVVQAQYVEGAAGAERGVQECRGRAGDLLRLQGRGQLPREFVKAARIGLAPGGGPGLLAQAGGQLADQQPDRQQDGERQQVLHVRDGERGQWLHEEEIEQRDADHRGQRRRPASVAQGRRHDRQQEDHDDIGLVQNRKGQARGQGGRRAIGQGPQIGAGGGVAGGRGSVAPRTRVAPWRGRGRRRRADPHDVRFRAGRRQDIGEAAPAQQPARRQGGIQQARQAAAAPRVAPDHGLGDVVAAHVAGRGVDHVGAGHGLDMRAQRLGQRQRLVQPRPAGARQGRDPRRLDGDGMPLAVQLLGQPVRAAQHMLGMRVGVDTGDHGLARAPDRLDRAFVAVRAHIVVDVFGGAAQRQFAQGDQIALAEEVPAGVAGLFRHIDPALAQAAQQFVGRQVHQDDLVGGIEYRVWHGFAHAHSGDAADRLVQAFQVLDVEGGPDVDAGRQQFLDVLPALGVARPGRVGVRQFVEQQQAGPARHGGLQVEFAQAASLEVERLQGQGRQRIEQRGGVGAAVGFDQPRHDIHALRGLGARRGQHGIGLAYAGAGAEVDAQPPAPGVGLRLLQGLEQAVGVEAVVAGVGHGVGVSRREGSRAGGTHTIRAPLQRRRSSARLRASTLTTGSPRMSGTGRSVCRAMSCSTVAVGRPRARATRAAW